MAIKLGKAKAAAASMTTAIADAVEAEAVAAVVADANLNAFAKTALADSNGGGGGGGGGGNDGDDDFSDSLATDNNFLDRHKFAENQTAVVAFKGQRREQLHQTSAMVLHSGVSICKRSFE